MISELQKLTDVLDALASQQPLITTIAALIAIWVAIYHAFKVVHRKFQRRGLAKRKNHEGAAKAQPNTTPPASA